VWVTVPLARVALGWLILSTGVALVGCAGLPDPAGNEHAIVAAMKKQFPDRAWAASCVQGAEQSVSCVAYFSTSTSEPFRALATTTADADAAIQDLDLPNSQSVPFVWPATRVGADKLAPMDMRCARHYEPGDSRTHPDFAELVPNYPGPVDNAVLEAFLARVKKYGCHAVVGDQTTVVSIAA
jgi:hypothetical protein